MEVVNVVGGLFWSDILVEVFYGDDIVVDVDSKLGVVVVVDVVELSDIFDVEFVDIFDAEFVDIFDAEFVDIFDAEVAGIFDVEFVDIFDAEVDIVVFGPAITTGGIFSLTGWDVFFVSFIMFDASFLRFSICFSVVSMIFDSTIASNNWTPVT